MENRYQGNLLRKFFIESVSFNFIFSGDGRLVMLVETKIVLASITAQEVGLGFLDHIRSRMSVVKTERTEVWSPSNTLFQLHTLLY